MRRTFRRTPVGLAIGLAVLLVAVGGTAQAKQENPNKTGARFHGPGEYHPDASSTEWSAAGIGQRACISSPNFEGNAAFIVALDVPDGASITKVTAYYYDIDPSEQLTFQVVFSEPGLTDVLDGFTEVTSVDGTPTGPPGGAQSVDLIPTAPVPVDNANRRYFLYSDFSACGTTVGAPGEESLSLLLDGIRVEYTLK